MDLSAEGSTLEVAGMSLIPTRLSSIKEYQVSLREDLVPLLLPVHRHSKRLLLQPLEAETGSLRDISPTTPL